MNTGTLSIVSNISKEENVTSIRSLCFLNNFPDTYALLKEK